MKWTRLLGLALTATLALTAYSYADEDFNVEIANPPSANTPAILEVTPTLPADAVEPTGQYKELAEVTAASVAKHLPGVKVRTMMRPGSTKTKTRLFVSYEKAIPVTFIFLSNCSVNSQFTVESPVLTVKADKTAPLPATLIQPWVSDVCAHWTLLNHDWVEQAASRPKTFSMRVMHDRLDITYDSNEVKAYKEAVAAIRKPQKVTVAVR